MSEASPAIQQFHAASQRITELQRAAESARHMPERAARTIDRLGLTYNNYGHPADDEKLAAEDMKARMRAEYVARAECERDLKLIDIASELCVIRANLTAIATAAAIELGTLAKNLRHEAEHGPDEPAEQA